MAKKVQNFGVSNNSKKMRKKLIKFAVIREFEFCAIIYGPPVTQVKVKSSFC